MKGQYINKCSQLFVEYKFYNYIFDYSQLKTIMHIVQLRGALFDIKLSNYSLIY